MASSIVVAEISRDQPLPVDGPAAELALPGPVPAAALVALAAVAALLRSAGRSPTRASLKASAK